ncbi:MAG: tRNA pseudouridine(55) synthase TruB [Burkholderiales bacterium]
MDDGVQAVAVQRRPRRQAVDGVLLLDKPSGISSQTAVSRARALLLAAKAGHTGTLDPMASGLLPVCFGEATKFSHLLLESDKTYAATVKLGVTTTTGDREGELVATAAVDVSRAQLEAVLRRFVGNLMQTPPMYSALKHHGRPLYEYARAGVALPRVPRPVTIAALDLVAFEGDTFGITVRCSKGTYIRVLAEDIGRELGCGACLAALRRTAVGGFRLDRDCGAIALEVLQDAPLEQRRARLLPVDALVATLPRIDLGAGEARRLLAGQELEWPEVLAAGPVRVYGPRQDFLGVARVGPAGKIVAQRLRAQQRDA